MIDNDNSSRIINYNEESYKNKYLGVVNYSKKFVNRTIDLAIEKIKSNVSSNDEICSGCKINSEDSWPTSGEINAENGLENIIKMMERWNSEPAMKSWQFEAEFIDSDSTECSDFYNYQVRWSVPTPAYPEPQIIVSVFFTIEAPKLKYKNCPVDVTYVFEGCQFPHNPKIKFRSKWIYDIFDTKTMIFKSLKF